MLRLRWFETEPNGQPNFVDWRCATWILATLFFNPCFWLNAGQVWMFCPVVPFTLLSKLPDADGVVFSVPEYAHGVPGLLKNSLDWVVGSGEFVDKPVALFNASARAIYVRASLTETLTVMAAKVVPQASVTLELLGKHIVTGQIAADPEMSTALRSAFAAFACAIEGLRANR